LAHVVHERSPSNGWGDVRPGEIANGAGWRERGGDSKKVPLAVDRRTIRLSMSDRLSHRLGRKYGYWRIRHRETASHLRHRTSRLRCQADPGDSGLDREGHSRVQEEHQ